MSNYNDRTLLYKYIVQYFVLGYTKENTECLRGLAYDVYRSFVDAKTACDSDNNCWGLYDEDCDNIGFTLCPYWGHNSFPSANSCVYWKPSNKFLFILEYPSLELF